MSLVDHLDRTGESGGLDEPSSRVSLAVSQCWQGVLETVWVGCLVNAVLGRLTEKGAPFGWFRRSNHSRTAQNRHIRGKASGIMISDVPCLMAFFV